MFSKIISLLTLFPIIPSLFATSSHKEINLISPLASSSAILINEENVLGQSTEFNQPVNILLLGLDARRGDKNPRCDTIHFITYDPTEKVITITTVPRGTIVDLKGLAENGGNYLGNMCHLVGIEKTKEIIEKIAGIQADYTVKVGFSQTLGILRTINFPTTPTLQFLRNRRYAIGDHQRSRNQAQFIKDMINTYFDYFALIPKPLKYLLYKMADTDLPFERGIALFEEIKNQKIYENPDKIILTTKPAANPYIKEIHYNREVYESANWQNDEEFVKYQINLQNYLQNLIARGQQLVEKHKLQQAYNLIKTPFSQKLWLQIEDEFLRNQIHFDFLTIYAYSSPEKADVPTLILDFITEMENTNQEYFKIKAEWLLEETR